MYLGWILGVSRYILSVLVWPGMPQYGDYVPTSWKNHIVLTIFPLGRSNCLQITKNNFSRFLAFTPLFRRFALSGVVHVKELDEIDRSVSKILHFMASGSVLENLSKIYRASIEHLSNIFRTSIEHLSKLSRKSNRSFITLH